MWNDPLPPLGVKAVNILNMQIKDCLGLSTGLHTGGGGGGGGGAKLPPPPEFHNNTRAL